MTIAERPFICKLLINGIKVHTPKNIVFVGLCNFSYKIILLTVVMVMLQLN